MSQVKENLDNNTAMLTGAGAPWELRAWRSTFCCV